MCQSRANGGRRCAAHQPGTLAVVAYLTRSTDLDEAQVQDVLKQVRAEAKGAPEPTVEEARAALVAFARRVAADDSLTDGGREVIEARLDRAFGDLSHGEVPTGATVRAWEDGLTRARAAQEAMDAMLTEAATALEQDPEQVRARMASWRNRLDYEDVMAPGQAFRFDQTPDVPADPATSRALRKLGWEAHLAQPLPVFVYGTLREGQANRGRFGPAIASSQVAVADGVAVYGPDRPFPFAKAGGEGQCAVGDLVYVTNDRDGAYARQGLDHLEGFNSDRPSNSLYTREQRQVRITGSDGTTREVSAWVYLASPSSADYFDEDEIIPDGDWVAARKAVRGY